MNNLYLIIDTNRYTGNFERELMAYVFGIPDNEAGDIYAEEEYEEFQHDAEQYDFDLVGDILETYDSSRRGRSYSEYHGWFIDPAPGKTECQAIYIAVNQKFSSKVFDIIKERLSTFTKRIPELEIIDIGYYQEVYKRLD